MSDAGIPGPARPGSIARILDGPLATNPSAEALVGGDTRYTYAELDGVVGRTAGALAACGIGAGDRIAATLPNRAEIVISFLAAMRLGAIWLGIPRPLAAAEKTWILGDAGAKLCLTDTGGYEEIDRRRADVPNLRHLLSVTSGTNDRWAEMIAAAAPWTGPIVEDPGTAAAIAYTSGTTGRPKGAVHTHHNLMLPGCVQRWAGTMSADVRVGVMLPLTILNLMVLGPLASLQAGAACITIDRIDAPSLASCIERERVTTFATVPTIIYDLLTHPDVDPEQLATLDRPGVGGADLPESLRDLYRERFGAEITIGYGLTEAPTSVTVSDPAAPPIPGEAGVALPQVEIHILDDDGRAVPPGEPGEICVAPRSEGPWAGVYTPMIGYWNRPEETERALAGGLLHTGDVGRLDDDGHLFVLDRRNDLILRGGANVYPAEVERVLHRDVRVAGCAVVGRRDPRLGESVVAFIELAPDARVSADELAALCGRELARYKVPSEWIFVDALPRSPMGKVRRAELRKTLQ